MSEEQEQVQEEALPTIFEYSAQVYQAMVESASTEPLGAQYGDEEGLVYDGFSTKLVKDLGLPTPYFTKIFRELQRMDCIRQLRRGGSTTTSRWVLLRGPTPDLFRTMAEGHKKKVSKYDQQAQMINDLNTRLGVVEDALGIRSAT